MLPFHLIFKTTYANKEQYDLREDHFGELIKEKGRTGSNERKEARRIQKISIRQRNGQALGLINVGIDLH